MNITNSYATKLVGSMCMNLTPKFRKIIKDTGMY